jgi:endo-1,4-beta-xylanase
MMKRVHSLMRVTFFLALPGMMHSHLMAEETPASPGVAPQTEIVRTEKSLKEAVAKRFKMGVSVNNGVMTHPAEAAVLLRHFDTVTPENCMKMNVTQPTEGVFRFEEADAFVSYAQKNNLEIVGHTLLWARPENTPEWFFKDGDAPASAELVLKRLETHISTVAGRYKGKLAMWDVVNEALADSDEEYLRDTEWTRLLGEEYIIKSFEYARKADPDALLIYNDYRCDRPGKLKKLIRLVQSIRAKGAPIDAIGLQAHYEYGMIPFEGIEATLQAMRELKVKVVFSELDMDVVTRQRWYEDDGKHQEELSKFDPYPSECPPEVLESQAAQYARLFALILKYEDVVERVTFWNLHDGQSWLNDWPWKRHNHPLLFDRNLRPKPAFDAVIETLETPVQ